MIDFKVTMSTTVLLVDDDVRHLELRRLAMQMSGFTVINAASPVEAISILNGNSSCNIDVAVLDYEMPLMTGCLLADYLKTRYPKLKTVLYSGAINIPENEMRSVDVFVPKSSGVAALVASIVAFGASETPSCGSFVVDDKAYVNAVN